MFCNKCGNELAGDVLFCSMCGSKVHIIEKSEVKEKEEPYKDEKCKGKGRGNGFGFSIPILVANIICILAPFLPIYKENDYGETINYRLWDLFQIEFSFRCEELINRVWQWETHHGTLLSALELDYDNLEKSIHICWLILILALIMLIVAVITAIITCIVFITKRKNVIFTEFSNIAMFTNCIYFGVMVCASYYFSQILYCNFSVPIYIWGVIILNLLNLFVFHREYCKRYDD